MLLTRMRLSSVVLKLVRGFPERCNEFTIVLTSSSFGWMSCQLVMLFLFKVSVRRFCRGASASAGILLISFEDRSRDSMDGKLVSEAGNSVRRLSDKSNQLI